jgi:release factor glutamine methyltransferase
VSRAAKSAVSSVRDAVGAAADALAAAGCETPRLDAELMMADALGVERAALVSEPGRGVPSDAARVIGERVRRRVAREPVAYILGSKGFRFVDVAVDARVLIPRPETELLVEVALELPAGARVHEVGTGSGAVSLALLDERPDLRVSASDISAAAIAVARSNAARLGADLDLAVLDGMPPEEFDLVLANLPYVADAELASLAPEIRSHEPREALLGGPDGLDPIRALLRQAPRGTALALEHSPGQAAAVREMLDDARTRRDLAERERVTLGRAR